MAIEHVRFRVTFQAFSPRRKRQVFAMGTTYMTYTVWLTMMISYIDMHDMFIIFYYTYLTICLCVPKDCNQAHLASGGPFGPWLSRMTPFSWLEQLGVTFTCRKRQKLHPRNWNTIYSWSQRLSAWQGALWRGESATFFRTGELLGNTSSIRILHLSSAYIKLDN